MTDSKSGKNDAAPPVGHPRDEDPNISRLGPDIVTQDSSGRTDRVPAGQRKRPAPPLQHFNHFYRDKTDETETPQWLQELADGLIRQRATDDRAPDDKADK